MAAMILNSAIRSAELKSLRQAGTEFIWQADPQWWNVSAPRLYPIVGRLPDGRIAHRDGTLTIPPHGFARDLPLTVREAAPSQVTLRLAAEAQTRGHLSVRVRADGQLQTGRFRSRAAARGV